MAESESSSISKQKMEWESAWSCWLMFQEAAMTPKNGRAVEIPSDKPTLAGWVEKQRDEYKKFVGGKPSIMNADMIRQMNSKGFVWESSPQRDGDDKSENKILPQQEETGKAPEKEANKGKKRPFRETKSSTENNNSKGNTTGEKTDDDKALEEETSKQPAKENDRPVTPEMEKMSATYMVTGDDDLVASLHHEEHFADMADEDYDNYSDEEHDDDTESDEDWAEKKVRAAKSRSKRASPRSSSRQKKVQAKSPSGAAAVAASTPTTPPPTTEEVEGNEKSTSASRYPRRSTRRTLSEGEPVYLEVGEEPDGKRQRLEAESPDGRNSVVYNVMKTSEKTGKKEVRSYSLRQLRRHVPEEKEDEVREQCKKEFADLLVCEEALEANKKKGIDYQTAKANATWETNFLEYLVFQKVYGHGIVPKVFAENPFLGRWTVRNRRWWKSKDKRLTRSRMKRLNAANFVWEAKKDPSFWAIQQQTTQEEDRWELKFQMLVGYKKEKGDCLVPKEYAPNMVLARWVGEQRKQMKAKSEGRQSALNDEREKRLRDLGFVFNTRTREHLRNAVLQRFQDRWNECFEKLLKFKEVHGHAAVPRRWKADKDLASWAMRQRSHGKKYKRGENNYLTKERFELLKSVDFVFEMDRGKKYPLVGVTSRGGGAGRQVPATAEEDGGASDGEEGKEDEQVAVPMELVEAKVVEEAVAAAVAEQSIEMDLDEKMKDVPLVVADTVMETSKVTDAPEAAESTLPATIEPVETLVNVQPTQRSEDKDAEELSQKEEEEKEEKTAKPAARKSKRTVLKSTQRKLPSRTRASRQTAVADAVDNDPKSITSLDAVASSSTRHSPRLARSTAPKSTLPSQKDGSQRNKKEFVNAEVDTMRRTRHSKMMVDHKVSTEKDDKHEGESVMKETEEEDKETTASPATTVTGGVEVVDDKDSEDKVDQPSSMAVAESEGRKIADEDKILPKIKEQPSDTNDAENADRKENGTEHLGKETTETTDQPATTVKTETEESVILEVEEAKAEEKTIVEKKEPPPKEPTPEELRAEALRKRRQHYKGMWVCEISKQDEHLCYVNYLAHEAGCADFKQLAFPAHVLLD